jgi:hypothetical protein
MIRLFCRGMHRPVLPNAGKIIFARGRRISEMKLTTKVGLAGVMLALMGHAAGAPITRLRRNPAMQEFVGQILLMTGLHNDVIVVTDPGAKGCAYATTVEGQQYIGVDPKCVGRLVDADSYQSRAEGILCHELAHLLSGHTTNRKMDNPIDEAAADEWSGWAMARIGATLYQAQTYAREFADVPSLTHPRRAARLEAIKRGWMRSQHEPKTPLETPGSWWGRLMDTPLPWLQSQKSRTAR